MFFNPVTGWCHFKMLNFRHLRLVAFAMLRFPSVLAFGILISISAHPAGAATGLRALDAAALQVKDPGAVPLIAICRAGDRLVAAGLHGAIVYSDDNGVTWHQAAVPVNVALTAVSFASPRIGWAVGHYGVILHTADAGATWQVQLNGLQANQLTLTAANAAIAANDPSPGTPLALKRADRFVAAGADKPFLTIWTPSPDEAIALGAYRLAMKTTDGGKTWVAWDLHVGDPISHNLYDVAALGPDLYIAGETGLVFQSTDGGDSFLEVTSPAAATMFGIVAAGDGGVLTFGVAGQAYKSMDGGKTWATVLSFDTNANLVAATLLGNGAVAIAGENGILYISHDHGQSFSRLPDIQPMAIYDIVQAANGDLIVAGNAGVLRVAAQDLN